MNKLSEIFQAWVDAANPTPEQLELATQRIEICDECPHKKQVNILSVHVCGLCGCPLNKKVFSSAGPLACPDKRWSK